MSSTVYSENGALFSELVPATGTRGNDGNNTNNMVYWKGTRLTSDKKQTTDKGDNKTLAAMTLPISDIGTKSGHSSQLKRSHGKTSTIQTRLLHIISIRQK